ncbi:MAG: DUF374 domain-containing protein [Firmicutes bacterium]|nr:DUF374 domain-containing protein [Bacillota bacterium]
MRNLWKRFRFWIIPVLAYIFNIISSRWTRLEVYGRENAEKCADQSILFAFWHGKLWLPAYFFRDSDYLVLSSLSRDGEYMTRILKRYHYRVIRGSSSRGGSRALLKLIKEIKKGYSGFITPDGPTGPIYKVKPGIVYLQEKGGAVIIPIGVAVRWKITVNSWDRLALPLPGTRAVMVLGAPVYLPEDETIEKRAEILEDSINQAQEKAERILKTGAGD